MNCAMRGCTYVCDDDAPGWVDVGGLKFCPGHKRAAWLFRCGDLDENNVDYRRIVIAPMVPPGGRKCATWEPEPPTQTITLEQWKELHHVDQ